MPKDPKDMTPAEKLEAAKVWFQSFKLKMAEMGIDLTDPFSASRIMLLPNQNYVEQSKELKQQEYPDPAVVKKFFEECNHAQKPALMSLDSNGQYKVKPEPDENPATWLRFNLTNTDPISDEDLLNLYQFALDKRLYVITNKTLRGADDKVNVPYVFVGPDNTCVTEALFSSKNYQPKFQEYGIDQQEWEHIFQNHMQHMDVAPKAKDLIRSLKYKAEAEIRQAAAENKQVDKNHHCDEYVNLDKLEIDYTLSYIQYMTVFLPSLIKTQQDKEKYGRLINMMKPGQQLSQADTEELSFSPVSYFTDIGIILNGLKMTDVELMAAGVTDENGIPYPKDPETFFVKLGMAAESHQKFKIGNTCYRIQADLLQKSVPVDAKNYTKLFKDAINSMKEVEVILYGQDALNVTHLHDANCNEIQKQNAGLAFPFEDFVNYNVELPSQLKLMDKATNDSAELKEASQKIGYIFNCVRDNLKQYYSTPGPDGSYPSLTNVKMALFGALAGYDQAGNLLKALKPNPYTDGVAEIIANKVLEDYVNKLNADDPTLWPDQKTTNREILTNILFDTNYRNNLLNTIVKSDYVKNLAAGKTPDQMDAIVNGRATIDGFSFVEQTIYNAMFDEKQLLQQLNMTKEELLKANITNEKGEPYAKEQEADFIGALLDDCHNNKTFHINDIPYKFVAGAIKPDSEANKASYLAFSERLGSNLEDVECYMIDETSKSYKVWVKNHEESQDQLEQAFKAYKDAVVTFQKKKDSIGNSSVELIKAYQSIAAPQDAFIRVYREHVEQFKASEEGKGKYPSGCDYIVELLHNEFICDQALEDLKDHVVNHQENRAARVIASKCIEYYVSHLFDSKEAPFPGMSNPGSSRYFAMEIVSNREFRNQVLANLEKSDFITNMAKNKTQKQILEIENTTVRGDYDLSALMMGKNQQELTPEEQPLKFQIHDKIKPTVEQSIQHAIDTIVSLDDHVVSSMYDNLTFEGQYEKIETFSRFTGSKEDDNTYTLSDQDKADFTKELKDFKLGLATRTWTGRSSDNYRNMQSAVEKLEDYFKSNQKNLNLETLSGKIQTVLTYTETYLSGKGVDPAKYPESLKGHQFKNDYEAKRVKYAGSLLNAFRQRQSSLSDLMRGVDPRLSAAWNKRQKMIADRRQVLHNIFQNDQVSLNRYEHSEQAAEPFVKHLFNMAQGDAPLDDNQLTSVKQAIAQVCIPALHKILAKQNAEYKPVTTGKLKNFLVDSETVKNYMNGMNREQIRTFLESNGEEQLIRELSREMGNTARIQAHIEKNQVQKQVQGPDKGPVGPQ